MNLGTLKKKDLFITNSRLEPIEGFYTTDSYNYDIRNWDENEEREYIELINKLEAGEVID